MKMQKERYFEIIGPNTGEVIGVCSLDWLETAMKDEPFAKFAEIDKQLFDLFNEGSRPWVKYKGKPVNIRTQLIIESAE